jgi:hypothetical protein
MKHEGEGGSERMMEMLSDHTHMREEERKAEKRHSALTIQNYQKYIFFECMHG